MILCGNPAAQYHSHKPEIDAAIARVLETGYYILGEETKAFEAEFADFLVASFAIGVGSGTEALHVALSACGIGPGDEVITVSHTAVATVAAIEMTGAKPVLVDIEPDFYTLDPGRLKEALTSKTKAIIPVHLYGLPADLEPIMMFAREYGLRVIEDSAQAHGAFYSGRRAGSIGDIGCFSFYPTKNLGALGDGGMVVTNDQTLADQARLLREYGWAERYISRQRGWNSRLDELQAAILRVKLRYLDSDNQKRAELAQNYIAALQARDIILPSIRPGTSHVFHQFVVRTKSRDRMLSFLRDHNVGASIHYPAPIHMQPAYLGRLSGCNRLPVTEAVAPEILSLPIYPELSFEEQDNVIAEISRFLKSAA